MTDWGLGCRDGAKSSEILESVVQAKVTQNWMKQREDPNIAGSVLETSDFQRALAAPPAT